jgi:hypothetical protein
MISEKFIAPFNCILLGQFNKGHFLITLIVLWLGYFQFDTDRANTAASSVCRMFELGNIELR